MGVKNVFRTQVLLSANKFTFSFSVDYVGHKDNYNEIIRLSRKFLWWLWIQFHKLAHSCHQHSQHLSCTAHEEPKTEKLDPHQYFDAIFSYPLVNGPAHPFPQLSGRSSTENSSGCGCWLSGSASSPHTCGCYRCCGCRWSFGCCCWLSCSCHCCCRWRCGFRCGNLVNLFNCDIIGFLLPLFQLI